MNIFCGVYFKTCLLRHFDSCSSVAVLLLVCFELDIIIHKHKGITVDAPKWMSNLVNSVYSSLLFKVYIVLRQHFWMDGGLWVDFVIDNVTTHIISFLY